MKIGMVGIGLMGHGMASNLVKHGHTLTLLDHPGNQPLQALRAAGAAVVASAREVAARSEAVLLVVTGSPQVEAVLAGGNGADGVLQGLRPGAIVIDCSTALPESTRRMAAAVQAAGGQFLDAPMTRTPKEAAEGRLNLLVGGDAALFERCRPLLQCFAENIRHVGPVGAGHAMKLLHNFVSLGTITLLAEAAACAGRSGVDAATFVDVLAQGGGGGVALERLKPYLLHGDIGALRFTIANAHKDIGYYAEMATGAQARHGVADAVLATLAEALQSAAPGAAVPELATLLAGR